MDSFLFNWETHGYDLFSKYLPFTTRLLNEQMDLAFNMTKQTFADKKQKLDTTEFRKSIIYYLKMIHGIRDETYKYA